MSPTAASAHVAPVCSFLVMRELLWMSRALRGTEITDSVANSLQATLLIYEQRQYNPENLTCIAPFVRTSFKLELLPSNLLYDLGL